VHGPGPRRHFLAVQYKSSRAPHCAPLFSSILFPTNLFLHGPVDMLAPPIVSIAAAENLGGTASLKRESSIYPSDFDSPESVTATVSLSLVALTQVGASAELSLCALSSSLPLSQPARQCLLVNYLGGRLCATTQLIEKMPHDVLTDFCLARCHGWIMCRQRR